MAKSLRPCPVNRSQPRFRRTAARIDEQPRLIVSAVALRGLVGLAAAAALFLLAGVLSPSPVLRAAGPPQFLSLPFVSASDIHIERGWWTRGSDGRFDLLEHGFDYIKGTLDVVPSWKSFEVVAAAPGKACGALLGQHGCIDYPGEIMGNRVLVKHRIDGVTYFTFYNHLKTIAPGIPIGNRHDTVEVGRGQLLGTAGATGDDPSLIHLYFELDDANLRPIDPYGIRGTSLQYPDPAGDNSIKSATPNYWLTNPPTVAAAPATSPASPPPGAPSPSGSTVPIPTPGQSRLGRSGSASPSPATNPQATDRSSPPSQSAGVTRPTPAATGPPGPSSASSAGDGFDALGLAIAFVVALLAASLVFLAMRMRRRP
jgi:hypothetical protein